MNARTTIVTALLIGTAACCAHTRVAPGPRKETVRFMGYRLELDLDDVGTPIGAKAFDPQGKEVPTAIVPLREESVCVKKPFGTHAGADPLCEPFTYMQEKTSWRSGSGTLCHYYSGGQIVYYAC
jgi:hypothetical protein